MKLSFFVSEKVKQNKFTAGLGRGAVAPPRLPPRFAAQRVAAAPGAAAAAPPAGRGAAGGRSGGSSGVADEGPAAGAPRGSVRLPCFVGQG